MEDIHHHKTPSVGAVTKKIVEINPRLTTHEIIKLIRQAIRPLGDAAGEFSSAEMIDEAKAIELARQTLTQ
jgi:hypothetical protein